MKSQNLLARFGKMSLSCSLLAALMMPFGATIAAPLRASSPAFEVSQSLEEILRQRQAEGSALMQNTDFRQRIAKLQEQAYRQASLGNYNQAISLLEEALQQVRQAGDRKTEAEILTDLGNVYTRQEDHKTAITYRKQGIEIAQSLPDFDLLPIFLISLGDDYFLQGDNRQALQYFEQAAQVAGKDEDSQVFLESALVAIGKVYLRQGDYAKAIAYADQAIKNTDPLNPALGPSRHLKGEALFRMGKLAEAEVLLRDVMQQYEGGRTQVSSFAEGSGFDTSDLFESQAAVSRVLQQVLLAQNKAAAALEVAEWGRSRIFAELLALKLTPEEQKSPQQRAQERFKQQFAEFQNLAQQFALSNGDRPPTPEQVQQLAEKAAQLQAIFGQGTPPENPEIEDSSENADNSRNAIVQLFQTPVLAPPSIEQIKQVARSRKATIVEYSIISDDTFGYLAQGKEQQLLIWVVQPTGEVAVRMREIKSLKDPLSKVVDQSRSALGVRGLSFTENAALVKVPPTSGSSQVKELQSLYRLLVEPIADLLPKDPNAHVIFIPQGSLFMVPFAALQDPAGKYLIERHTVLTAPAVGVLLQTAQQRERLKTNRLANSMDYLVVGNPIMPSIAFKPGAPPQQLPSLPGAEKEAREIADVLQQQGLTGQALTSQQATKAVVVQTMQRARVVHLATHGLLDDIQGLGTPGAIALAPDDPTVKDSGLLTASEILGMRLNSELVVLSACDTGRGRITGDGVIGLSRSLVLAGAPSVMVSLWQVPDEATGELMLQFYKTLKTNPDKAQALRQAMLATMKQYPDPKAWAAFTLIGEAQ